MKNFKSLDVGPFVVGMLLIISLIFNGVQFLGNQLAIEQHDYEMDQAEASLKRAENHAAKAVAQAKSVQAIVSAPENPVVVTKSVVRHSPWWNLDSLQAWDTLHREIVREVDTVFVGIDSLYGEIEYGSTYDSTVFYAHPDSAIFHIWRGPVYDRMPELNYQPDVWNGQKWVPMPNTPQYPRLPSWWDRDGINLLWKDGEVYVYDQNGTKKQIQKKDLRRILKGK